MLEKSGEGKISLVANLNRKDYDGGRGSYTVEEVEEFVNELRMAGVPGNKSIWFSNPNSKVVPDSMFVKTDSSIVIQSGGKQVVYKNNGPLLALSITLSVLLGLLSIFMIF